MDGNNPEYEWKPPFNRPDNRALRRVERAGFTILLLLLSASLAFRGVLLLREGRADFPFPVLSLPELIRYPAAGLYLILAAGIAVASLAMAIRFRK